MSNRKIDVPRSHHGEPRINFRCAIPEYVDAVIIGYHYASDRLGDLIGALMGSAQLSLPQPPIGGRTDEAI